MSYIRGIYPKFSPIAPMIEIVMSKGTYVILYLLCLIPGASMQLVHRAMSGGKAMSGGNDQHMSIGKLNKCLLNGNESS